MVNATPAGMVEFEGKFYQPAERDAILAARAAKASADAAAALQPGEVYDHQGRLVAGWRPSDLVPAEYLADPEAYEPSVGNELVTEGQLVGTLDLIGTGGGGGGDPLAVKLTGDQTVGGVKTFTSAPIVPDGSFTQAKVVNLTTDLAAKAADNAVVKLTGNQTIAGVKTFSTAPVVPDGSFTQAKIVNLASDLNAIRASQTTPANQVLNGTGTLGNNTNFTALTFTDVAPPVGTAGSFVTPGTGSTSVTTTQPIRYYGNNKAIFSFLARQTVPTSTGKLTGRLACYDPSGVEITSSNVLSEPGTLTTLAQPFGPGDTVLHLTSVANWFGSVGKPAGANSWRRGIIVWGYVDGTGKTWGPGEYSRWVHQPLWADGAVDTVSNTITLTAPFAPGHGLTFPAGTQLSNCYADGSTISNPVAAAVTVPETWTEYTNELPRRRAATHGYTGWGWDYGLPFPTHTVKPTFTLNSANNNNGKHAIAGIRYQDTEVGWSTINSKIVADGTDQAATLQAEIDLLSLAGGDIEVGRGEFLFTTPITLKPQVTIRGVDLAGIPWASNGTRFKFSPSAVSDFMTLDGTGYQMNVGLHNLAIVGGNTNASVGVNLTDPAYCHFSKLRISGFDRGLVMTGSIHTTFEQVYAYTARTAGIHITNASWEGTTTSFFDCYSGQHNNAATARPLVIDNDSSLGIYFYRFCMETCELGASLGSGNVVSFDATYTENIPHTSAATAVFEIGKSGAPTVANADAMYSFSGGTLAGSNFGVHADSSMFDVDYCHSLVVSGVRMARVGYALKKTANTKAATFIGTTEVQIVNGTQTVTGITNLGNYSGGYQLKYDDVLAKPRASGVVDVDSFAGANDDAKMLAALTYAAAQTRVPAVRLRHGVTTLANSYDMFTGMKVIGAGAENMAFGEEVGSGKAVISKIRFTGASGTSSLFKSSATINYVTFANLAFHGDPDCQIFHSTGNVYGAQFHNLDFYGCLSAFGNDANAFLMTFSHFTGFWTVNAPNGTQIRVGGSDCTLWMGGQANIGGNPSVAGAGKYLVELPGCSKTNVGYAYITANNGWRGLRTSGDCTGLTMYGGVYEGQNDGDPSAGNLIRCEGTGTVRIRDPFLAYGMTSPAGTEHGIVEVACSANGQVLLDGFTYRRDNDVAETVPVAYVSGGSLRVLNGMADKQYNAWTGLPRVQNAGGTLTNDASVTVV